MWKWTYRWEFDTSPKTLGLLVAGILLGISRRPDAMAFEPWIAWVIFLFFVGLKDVTAHLPPTQPKSQENVE